MSRSDGFPRFVVDQADHLARTAYLLTGDPVLARALAVRTLVAIGKRWSGLRWNRPGEAMVRELYQAYLTSNASPPEDFPLARMSTAGRAALVAQFYNCMPQYVAAQVCGLYPPMLQEETARARALLEPLQEAHKAPTEADEPHQDPPAWQPPTQDADAQQAPHQDADAWQPPHQDADAWQAPHQNPTWEAPHSAAETPAFLPPAVPSSPEAAPERDPTLARLAADLPRVDVVMEVLDTLARRKRIKYSLVATLSTALVVGLVAIVVAGVVSIADRVERVTAEPPTETSSPTTSQQLPDPLPATLEDTISYAYTGYCVGEEEDGPCGNWRVVTADGAEWRVADARSDLQEDGDPWPFAVSEDGRRIAYLSSDDDYVVKDLRTGAVKKINVRNDGVGPSFVFSPKGRYAAVNFDDEDSAMLDFTTGVTTYFYDEDVLALREDNWQVTAEREAVRNVAGHATVTTLRLNGPDYSGYDFRIDPTLLEHGVALSPDGKSLVMISDDLEVIRMDARTGKIAKERPSLEADLPEVDLVERWLGGNKVLVRTYDDDFIGLVTLDAVTGKSLLYELDGSEEIDYTTELGKLD